MKSPPSPVHTRYGKAKRVKDSKPFYKGYKGEGMVYLPGDINGLARKLQLLVAEFFAGNTTVKKELVHVLDALLRLKQLTRNEYTIYEYYRSFSSIIMIVYRSSRFAASRYQF